MNVEEQNYYITNIIKAFPDDCYPNNKIKIYRYKKSGKIELFFEKHKTIMTILKDNTIDEIIRNITKHLNKNNINYICNICYNERSKSIFCNKCSNDFCYKCYIDIFKKNQGLIICPYCRYTIGDIIPEFLIPYHIGLMVNNCQY